MALSSGERAHNFYMRRKLNGLCTRCGKPLDRDGEYCVACLAVKNEEARSDRQWRAGNHLCTTCGKFSVPNGQKTCPECKAKIANRRKPKTDEQNQKFNASRRSIYERRSLNGICTRCGKRNADAGRKKCKLCLQKDAQTHAEARIRRGEDLRAQWKEQGLCFHCGGEIEDKSKKSCNACREKCITKTGAGAGENKAWIEDNRLIFNRY